MATIRELAERDIAAFNARDEDGLVADAADDVELTSSGGMTARGKEEVKQFNRGWYAGFPDCRVELTALHDAGSVGIIEGEFTGTHTGVFPTPMGDIPPTNRSVRGQYIQIFELRGGKVARVRLYFDRMQLMEQLGLVPTGAAAG